MKQEIPSEYDLQAYVDGQLNESQRRRVEAYLVVHPESARQVQQLKKENQQLRAALAGHAFSSSKSNLDPAQIRHALFIRARRRLAIAATLILSLGIGGLGGWQARDIALQANVVPMADAVQAYKLFAMQQQLSLIDVAATTPAEMQSWLNHHLIQPAPLPDFTRYGFKPVGGRLLATEQGAAAMVLYRDVDGQSIIFYVRPSGHLNIGKGNRKEGNLLAQYWNEGRYNYAVVSPADTPNTRAVQHAIEPAI